MFFSFGGGGGGDRQDLIHGIEGGDILNQVQLASSNIARALLCTYYLFQYTVSLSARNGWRLENNEDDVMAAFR